MVLRISHWRACMCGRACARAQMGVCVLVYLHMHLSTRVHIYPVCMGLYVCVCTCVHVCVQVHARVFMHVCILLCLDHARRATRGTIFFLCKIYAMAGRRWNSRHMCGHQNLMETSSVLNFGVAT